MEYGLQSVIMNGPKKMPLLSAENSVTKVNNCFIRVLLTIRCLCLTNPYIQSQRV